MSLFPQIQIGDALKQHSALIAKVRETCKDDIAKDIEQFNDDLFLLRFCISQKGDLKLCCEALKECVSFRTKNKTILDRLANEPDFKHPDEVLLGHFLPLGQHKQDKNGNVIFVSRAGLGNMDAAMEMLNESIVENAMNFGKEKIYRICNEESKKRGYLVCMIGVQDFKGGSVLNFNRKFMGIMKNAQEKMLVRYPALIGAAVAVNPLSVISVIARISKIDLRVCKAKSTRTGDVSTCPYATKLFDLSILPSFLGGTCRCPGGCIGGVENDCKEKVVVVEAEVKKLLKEREQRGL